MNELNNEHIAWLNNFNEKLRAIELQAFAEMQVLERQLTLRVKDQNDPLNDYHIEAIVHFSLHESDPEFSEDSDNFITEDKIFSRRDDYNEITDFAYHDRNFGIRNHCYLFHEIFEHLHLNLWDILRIGHVWVDIKPCYQYFYDFEPSKKIHIEMTTCSNCQKQSSFVFECWGCGDVRCIYCDGKNNDDRQTPHNYHQEQACFNCGRRHSIDKIEK